MLVLGGPHAKAGELSVALDALYEITVVQGKDASEAISRTPPFQAVLADVGDYLPLEREMVSIQSVLLLNALGEGVCLTDADGTVLWGNIKFQRYEPTTRARIAAACRQAARILEASDGEAVPESRLKFEVASADESRFYQVMASPLAVPIPPGPHQALPQPRHVAALVWDVTGPRRRQSRTDAINRAGAELVRLDAELIRKMNTVERLRVLEQKIVTFAHDLFHFDHFAIRLLEERTGKLELVMSQGLPPAAMEVELYARREGNGISGYVAASGRSYICPDTTHDPRYVIGIESARSSLTIPLRLSDKVIGVFNVESTQAHAFTEEDREFAEIFSTHVALALHILDLLVVERCATGAAVTGTVEGEVSEPLEDIVQIAQRLKGSAATEPTLQRHIDRIIADVEAVRRRVKDVASGPGTILGAEKALTDAAVDPALAGKRILVADDDPRIRQVVRDVLRLRGADVVLCEDGASAVEVLNQSGLAPMLGAPPLASSGGPGQERGVGVEVPAPAGRPVRSFDLLVSDIKLPDKTGYEIFAAARKVNPGLPVILMTGFGYDPHHSIVRASQEGLSCVLFKPFQAERLLEEVHKALAKK